MANDPNQMTLHFTFPSSASERWKLLTFTVEAGKKARAVCLYVGLLLSAEEKKLFDGALELLTIWQKGEEAFFANKMSVGTFNFFFHLFFYNCPSMDK